MPHAVERQRIQLRFDIGKFTGVPFAAQLNAQPVRLAACEQMAMRVGIAQR